MDTIITSPLSRQIFVCAGIFTSGLAQGSSIGYAATLLPQMRKDGIEMSRELESWIASMLGMGLIFGTITAPFIMAKFGRKPANIASVVFLAMGWSLLLVSENVYLILLARLLKGIGMGKATVVGGVAIAEYTSPKKRGYFSVVGISTSFTLGIFLVHAIGAQVSRTTTTAICLVFPVVSLIIYILSPESPHWLADKGKYEESKRVFRWLRGETEKSVKELDSMLNARIMENEHKAKRTLKDDIRHFLVIFKKRELLMPLYSVAHLYMMCQITGLNIFAAYAIDILHMIFDKDVDVSFWASSVDFVRLIGIVFSAVLVRKLKRRTLLFLSGATGASLMLCVALFSYLSSIGKFHNPWVVLMLLLASTFVMILGIQPLPFAIAGEIFPMEVRSVGNCIGIIILNTTLFVGLKTAPALLDALGIQGFYLIYGSGIIYCLIVLWFNLPETKDKTLQNIEDYFKSKGKSPRLEVEKSNEKNGDEKA